MQTTLNILVQVMKDVKIRAKYDISEKYFIEHVSLIVSEVAENEGQEIDCYQLLDEIVETIIALCNQYRNMGIFKELADDGDWEFSAHYIYSRELILLVED